MENYNVYGKHDFTLKQEFPEVNSSKFNCKFCLSKDTSFTKVIFQITSV